MRPTERPVEGVTHLRDEDVPDWLETRESAVLLFWDADDALSQRLRARLEPIVAASNLALGVVDARRDPLVAQALGVKNVPTTIVFRHGEVVERIMGAPPESVLAEALRPAP